jgi:murein DD-endopeptidase MepM/ murein hydrolase activator NlpD
MKYIITLFFLFPCTLLASEWVATQGDMIEVHTHSNTPIQSLSALGKTWPIKQLDKHEWQGWIGIDLKQKSGTYPILWQTKHSNIKDSLQVNKSKFRISNITVSKKMSNFDAKAIQRIHADQQAIKQTYDMKVELFPDFSKVRMPVQGIESTPFGAQRYVNGQPRSPHSGIDIAAPKGTPIIAPLDGKVLLVADMFLNGKLIAIGHGAGLVTLYAHLGKTLVQVGDDVQAGQKIAEVGMSGRSTGPHLHWGVKFNHTRINPHSLLALKNTYK